MVKRVGVLVDDRRPLDPRNSHLVGSDGGTDHADTDHARHALREVSTGACS